MTERPEGDGIEASESPSLLQRLHEATGDRDAEAATLASSSDDDVSVEDAKVAVQLAHGERGAPAPDLDHDVATPEDAEAVHDARAGDG
jgi:hypothetical protein